MTHILYQSKLSSNFPQHASSAPSANCVRKILIFHFKWKKSWLIQMDLALDLKTTACSGNNQTDVSA